MLNRYILCKKLFLFLWFELLLHSQYGLLAQLYDLLTVRIVCFTK